MNGTVNNTSFFKDPPKEFRGLPFWAWNTDITYEKIKKQVAVFKEMGLGGFVIHVRHGLRNEYMGETFLTRVKETVDEAKKNDLTVWLYDEDRWPSGCTGGIVTKEKRFRQKSLVFTRQRREHVEREEGILLGKPWLLAAYNITLDGDHRLVSSEICDEDNAEYFAYVITAADSPRYNGQACVDVLDEEAIQKFIETTYDVYYDLCGNDFGDRIEAIFTDEPQVTICASPKFSDPDRFTDTIFPWSSDFDKTYEECFGEDIVKVLPELIWDRSDRKLSTVRYRFSEHIAERFRKAYSIPIGKWCKEHNIAFTGHFMLEGSLTEQLTCTRDVMRCYPDFGIPGIDNLCGRYEFTTAKQCQSVARQCGITRVMSELYGVTNWTADFRDYIHQGNWQAAMGITARVPHLTWMTMKGVGKRDYPANFGYQSPWYREFGRVEDHFARLNTVLTSGEPIVNVGVIHPVESFWFYSGANDKNFASASARDKAFGDFCSWLAFDGVDFDYINEALIPEQYNDGCFGKMKYQTVIVPDCITLRQSTFKALMDMKERGVKIIFAGNLPTHLDGVCDKRITRFAEKCDHIAMTKQSLSEAMDCARTFEFRDENGTRAVSYIHQERIIDGTRWLFITPAVPVTDKEKTSSRRFTLRTRGKYVPKLYNTISGDISVPEYRYDGEYTEITLKKYYYTSFLLSLENKEADYIKLEESNSERKELRIPHKVSYIREEDNVCLLDMAQYSYDGISYTDEEEIFRIDTTARKNYDLPAIIGKSGAQPWSVINDTEYPIWLRFSFESEIETVCKIAFEKADKILFNGNPIEIIVDGSYVDDDIMTVTLPKTHIGHNEITVRTTLSKTYGVEPMYLVGDFNVRLTGTEKTLIPTTNVIGFGDSTPQGLPFYGGNIVYKTDIETPECDLEITVSAYRGDLVTVMLDTKEKGAIILPPYTLRIKDVPQGKHTLSIRCFGNRNNTFGSLHSAVNDPYHGPNHWYKKGNEFSYEYDLCKNGILKAPVVTVLKKEK